MSDNSDDCKACSAARADALAGAYRAGCDQCLARFLARSKVYFDAARADAMTPAYKSALRAAFGERWQEGHQWVKEWAK